MFEDFGWENLRPLLDGMRLTIFLVVASGFFGTVWVSSWAWLVRRRVVLHGRPAPSTSASSVANQCSSFSSLSTSWPR